ncbi:class I SAM-dependent methyltransferase [Plantactinospora siamensis]|uniref:S-adenosyl-L-methionine-dependent methyltransferase n=1 Tax=Plantactinospora siamensis TaxID=555372 RepID=A0ABV6P087_9ACTN
MTTSVGPSQTALMAAAARAAHPIVDGEPLIFADPLAETLLGDVADELIDYHRKHGRHLVLAGARAQVTCRSRYTEDLLAAAVDRGVDQYVLLGAGLDSFAYRSPLAQRIRTFELDAPGTQRWKRDRVATAGLATPAGLRYVPVDLERDNLTDALRSAGFDPTRPAVLSWLGVLMYLTRPALEATLAQLGRFAPGTRLVLDHMVPAELRDEAGQTYVDLVGPTSADRGEPWRTFLAPDELADLLTRHGFTAVESTDQRELFAAHGWERDWLRPSTLTRLASATIGGGPQE